MTLQRIYLEVIQLTFPLVSSFTLMIVDDEMIIMMVMKMMMISAKYLL